MGLFAFNRARRAAAQAQQPVAEAADLPETNTAQAQQPVAGAPKRGRKKTNTANVKEPGNGNR